MKNYTRVFRFGHELLVPTTVGDAPIKLFLVDSGSLMNQITPAAARVGFLLISESTGTEISGILGFVTLHFLNIKID
jgi:hypothetical protein